MSKNEVSAVMTADGGKWKMNYMLYHLSDITDQGKKMMMVMILIVKHRGPNEIIDSVWDSPQQN